MGTTAKGILGCWFLPGYLCRDVRRIADWFQAAQNRNHSKERIQLKKYDPVLRKRVMYKEAGKL